MNIQTKCKIIGDYGCLAFIYLWCAELPESLLISDFNKLWGKGIIDKECTVLDAERYFAHFGIKASVNKSFEAPMDGSRYAARWECNGFAHWVGMINGKVVENTLDYSNCVAKGKINEANTKDPPYRIIKVI